MYATLTHAEDLLAHVGRVPAPLVVWTPEMAGMIDAAVRHIVSRVPWLGRGKTMVVEIHY